MDFYFRNTDLDMNKVYYPSWVSDTRFFRQHLVVINVSDQFNETGSGVIDIEDNHIFNGDSNGNGADLETLKNPTSHLLVATDENGTAETWLTERLFLARSSSPVVITEYDFWPYNLTAKTWNTNTTQQLSLSSNSTIPVKFDIIVPEGALPPCTLAEMLDLNNDGFVDHDDSIIVLRYLAGWNVEPVEAKECTGINLNIVGNPSGN